MAELVRREDHDGIAVLTLNRPEALNALSPALFVDLRAHVDAVAAAVDAVGCVILRGAGRSFSAGNDLKAIQRGEAAPTPTFPAETIDALERLPQPVIAAVRGHCYTGGMELVLACDLLVCSDTARFCDTHGRWGMVPRWGMTQRLPRRVGPLRARELMFTGRVVDGAEAVAIGLANRCVPDAELDDEARALAGAVVANSWDTLRGDKRLLRAAMEHHLGDGLALERRASPGRSAEAMRRIAGFGKPRRETG